MSKRTREGEGDQKEGGLTEVPESTESLGRADTSAETKAGAGIELEALTAQVAAKDKELAELQDKYLRALAEQDNTRKRLRHQSEENLRLQREALLRELLPIVDNLELAVAAARGGGNGKPIVEGVEMVLRSIHDLLRNHGVTPHEAVGQPFDPQFHEAVDHVESIEHKPNTVISEFHRGYRIGDRALRPARVTVAKAPAGDVQAGKSDTDEDDAAGGERS